MDRRERYSHPYVQIQAAMENHQAEIWTATPAIVVSYNDTAMTVVLDVAIQAKVLTSTKAQYYSDVTISNLVDVPVAFPSGGGFTLTFPLAKGDEGIVVFSSRCIDAWWQSGGIQPQAEMRMHDIADGMFIPGLRSQPRVITTPSTTSVQLRSDDGSAYLELAAGHILNIVAPGGLNVTGNLTVTGSIIGGYGGADQVGLQTHKHPTAASGVPSSPTAGT